MRHLASLRRRPLRRQLIEGEQVRIANHQRLGREVETQAALQSHWVDVLVAAPVGGEGRETPRRSGHSPIRLRRAFKSPFLGPRAKRLWFTSHKIPASAQVPHCGRCLSPEGGTGVSTEDCMARLPCFRHGLGGRDHHLTSQFAFPTLFTSRPWLLPRPARGAVAFADACAPRYGHWMSSADPRCLASGWTGERTEGWQLSAATGRGLEC